MCVRHSSRRLSELHIAIPECSALLLKREEVILKNTVLGGSGARIGIELMRWSYRPSVNQRVVSVKTEGSL